MTQSASILAVLLDAVNDVKNTGFTPDSVDLDFFLGGDLGIDSREMLEIWYEVEQRLDIRVPDNSKRDLYTVTDVVALIQAQVGTGGTAQLPLLADGATELNGVPALAANAASDSSAAVTSA